jgi:hypothetical protein
MVIISHIIGTEHYKKMNYYVRGVESLKGDTGRTWFFEKNRTHVRF